MIKFPLITIGATGIASVVSAGVLVGNNFGLGIIARVDGIMDEEIVVQETVPEVQESTVPSEAINDGESIIAGADSAQGSTESDPVSAPSYPTDDDNEDTASQTPVSYNVAAVSEPQLEYSYIAPKAEDDDISLVLGEYADPDDEGSGGGLTEEPEHYDPEDESGKNSEVKDDKPKPSDFSVITEEPQSEKKDQSIKEVEAIEVKEPEVEEPEVKEPEVTEPEVKEPEVKEPEVKEPEVTEPEVKEPEVKEPEVTEPEVKEPEVTEPEVKEPEVTEPEVEEPEVKEPEVKEPEVKEPEVTEPEVEEPEVKEPEVEEPEVKEPEVKEPEVTEPEVKEPEVTDPEDPEVTDPEDPEVTDPEDPEVTDPEDPEVTDPEDPVVTDPVTPDPQDPEVPGDDEHDDHTDDRDKVGCRYSLRDFYYRGKKLGYMSKCYQCRTQDVLDLNYKLVYSTDKLSGFISDREVAKLLQQQ